MKHANSTILAASDVTSQTSAKIDASELYKVSFQASFKDITAAGTLTVQASNDVPGAGYLPASFTPTNWTTIPGITATVTAGATTIIPTFDLSYRWIRVVYTATTPGSTTMTVNMFAIGV